MKNKEQKEEAKLMETSQIVHYMDVLYHINRENNGDEERAVEYMQQLIDLIKEASLDQVYFSPTELIINAVICYKDCMDNIDSDIDKKICELVCKLGYLKKTKTQV